MIKLYLIHPSQNPLELVQQNFSEWQNMPWIVPDRFHSDYLNLILVENYGLIQSVYAYEMLENSLKPSHNKRLIYQFSQSDIAFFNRFHKPQDRYHLARKLHSQFLKNPAPFDNSAAAQEAFERWQHLRNQKNFYFKDTQNQFIHLFLDQTPIILSQSPKSPHYSTWFYQLHQDARPMIWLHQCLVSEKNEMKRNFKAFNPNLNFYKAQKTPQSAYTFRTFEEEIEYHLQTLTSPCVLRLPPEKSYQAKIQDRFLAQAIDFYTLKQQPLCEEATAMHIIQLIQILSFKNIAVALQKLQQMPWCKLLKEESPSQGSDQDTFEKCLNNCLTAKNAYDWCYHFEKTITLLHWPPESADMCETICNQCFELAALSKENDFDLEMWLLLVLEIVQTSPFHPPLKTLPECILINYSDPLLLEFGEQRILGFHSLALPWASSHSFGTLTQKEDPLESYPWHQLWQDQKASFSMHTADHHYLVHPLIDSWQEGPHCLNLSKPFTESTPHPSPKLAELSLNRLSITGLERYQRCHYQFYLNTVVKVPEFSFEKDLFSASEWGNCLHKIVELALQHALKQPFSRAQFLASAQDCAETFIEQQHLNPLQSHALFQTGALMHQLAAFFETIFDSFSLVHCEFPISYKLPNSPLITGTIDLLLKHKKLGQYLILDLKTGKKIATKTEIACYRSLQLGFYSMVIAEQLGPVFGAGFLHAQLSELASPLALAPESATTHPLLLKSRQTTLLDAGYLEGLKARLEFIVRAIQNQKFMLDGFSVDEFLSKNRVQLACHYCNYHSLCDEPKRYQGQR